MQRSLTHICIIAMCCSVAVKCVLALALVVEAPSHQIYVTGDDLDLWQTFKMDHKKEYNSEEEEYSRNNIFSSNLKFVREHNAKFRAGEVTFDVALNRFADLTSEEFSQLMNGYKRPAGVARSGRTFEIPDDEDLPKAMDWRKDGAVTEVEDQGYGCLSCWAFSAAGALEGQNYIVKRNLVSLSEQNLIDCATGEDNDGCNGGWMDQAFIYVQKNGGIDTAESYPYEGHDGYCRYTEADRGAVAMGYVDIPSGDESALQTAVALKGPVSVAMDASLTSFQFYKSGVYGDPRCGNTEYGVNHAALAVGYGTSTEGDYWIVKNCWGTGWGMDGYLMLARNHNNMCGVATVANYPILASANYSIR